MDRGQYLAVMLRLISLFLLPLACSANPFAALDRLADAQPISTSSGNFLPMEEAFIFHAEESDGRVTASWQIADGYYLYRNKMAITGALPGAVGPLQSPAGELKDDPEFGQVEVYRNWVSVSADIVERGNTPITIAYQGCAEDGICYPPAKQRIELSPTASGPTLAVSAPLNAVETGQVGAIRERLANAGLWKIALTFFGFGVLLSLTPCVFPMIPILSGIIAGQRAPMTARKGFALSLTYVVAMASAYAIAGLVAALLGQNLQAAFQHPAIIIAFAGVFVLLALSMFGFYELQLPSTWQTRLDALSRSQAGGSYIGVAAMGLLSAIIVGPCVAPPLAAGLAFIGHDGRPVIGGLSLFAMGIGMGVPLLILGVTAGSLLPAAGRWMEGVKFIFGVILLGVAVWFLERVFPGPLTVALYGLLLVGTAAFIGVLDTQAPRWTKALGLPLLIYGGALLVGAAAGTSDPLQPLAQMGQSGGSIEDSAPTNFKTLYDRRSIAEQLAQAQRDGRPVLLDVYADWCVECKHLERETLAHPAIKDRLAHFVLLRADVTANNDEHRLLLQHYQLYGPPALLFFRDSQELSAARLIGFIEAEDLSAHLDRFAL